MLGFSVQPSCSHPQIQVLRKNIFGSVCNRTSSGPRLLMVRRINISFGLPLAYSACTSKYRDSSNTPVSRISNSESFFHDSHFPVLRFRREKRPAGICRGPLRSCGLGSNLSNSRALCNLHRDFPRFRLVHTSAPSAARPFHSTKRLRNTVGTPGRKTQESHLHPTDMPVSWNAQRVNGPRPHPLSNSPREPFPIGALTNKVPNASNWPFEPRNPLNASFPHSSFLNSFSESA